MQPRWQRLHSMTPWPCTHRCCLGTRSCDIGVISTGLSTPGEREEGWGTSEAPQDPKTEPQVPGRPCPPRKTPGPQAGLGKALCVPPPTVLTRVHTRPRSCSRRTGLSSPSVSPAERCSVNFQQVGPRKCLGAPELLSAPNISRQRGRGGVARPAGAGVCDSRWTPQSRVWSWVHRSHGGCASPDGLRLGDPGGLPSGGPFAFQPPGPGFLPDLPRWPKSP